MSRGRLGAFTALSALLAAGCGGATAHVPDLRRLPLVEGARVVASVRECDRGADAYCALQLVVVSARFKSSSELLAAQHQRLRRGGWTGANADTGDERAAESPGHRLRVTYATAFGDLLGIVRGWIKRPGGLGGPLALALSRTIYDRQAAMSLLLELGPR